MISDGLKAAVLKALDSAPLDEPVRIEHGPLGVLAVVMSTEPEGPQEETEQERLARLYKELMETSNGTIHKVMKLHAPNTYNGEVVCSICWDSYDDKPERFPCITAEIFTDTLQGLS